MTTGMLTLNCWILGEDPQRVFHVEIACWNTVGNLKDTIKMKTDNFDGFDADALRLWKVSSVRLPMLNTISDTLQGQYRLGEALPCTQDNQGRGRYPR